MRLNVELNDPEVELMDDICRYTGVTKKKVVINALNLLSWAMTERARGNAVVAMPRANIPYSSISTFWSDLLGPDESDLPSKP
jgi:hypothetical protein